MHYKVFEDQTIDGTTTEAESAIIPLDLGRGWRPNGDIAAAVKCESSGDVRDIDLYYKLVGKVSGETDWCQLIDDFSAQTDQLGASCDDDNMHPINVEVPWVMGIQFKVARGSGDDADCTVNMDLYIN